jgi:serine/threonine protein kinase
VLVSEFQLGGTRVFEKRLSSRERDEPEAIASLRSEAALLQALGGRGAPRLVGAGDDDKGPFLRTEAVPFPTLADRLGAPVDRAWIDRAFRASLEALTVVHEARDERGPLAVVHADLSPSNLAIDDEGTSAVLLDFGLARWRDEPVRDKAFRGTVAYVAPEIARGERAETRSDLFALAASFLHALAGKAPRTGPTLAAMLAAAAEHPIAAPEHPALAACLAHDPSARPASARALLATLSPAC